MARNKRTPEEEVKENMDAAMVEAHAAAGDSATATAEQPSNASQEAPRETNGHGAPVKKEAKDVRFYRLATRRVPRAMKAIRAVRNLANKNQYAYTEAHASKIIDALTAELSALKLAFNGQRESGELFSL